MINALAKPISKYSSDSVRKQNETENIAHFSSFRISTNANTSFQSIFLIKKENNFI